MRYAAWILFQFRVEENGISNKRRICEEKIYHIKAQNPNDAYNKGVKIGKEEEFCYEEQSKIVYYEFIGIIDLIELFEIEDKNVVWDRFIEKIQPMENRDKIIPPPKSSWVFLKQINIR